MTGVEYEQLTCSWRCISRCLDFEHVMFLVNLRSLAMARKVMESDFTIFHSYYSALFSSCQDTLEDTVENCGEKTLMSPMCRTAVWGPLLSGKQFDIVWRVAGHSATASSVTWTTRFVSQPLKQRTHYEIFQTFSDRQIDFESSETGFADRWWGPAWPVARSTFFRG